MMFSHFKETRTCQVCKKSFSNGNALGGHMRSHTLKLSTESETGSIPSSLTTFNKRGANLRPHGTVLMRSVNTSDEVVMVSSTESQYCLTVEEAAYCLLQMSKDKWPQNLQNPKYVEDQESSNKYVDEDGDVKFSTSYVEVPTEDNEESTDDDEELVHFVAEERKCKKQYICDICGKVLSSHQALGGHRTSHGSKRLKISDKKIGKATCGPVVRRHFECQFCGRVFTSGQALGGHKKVHYAFL